MAQISINGLVINLTADKGMVTATVVIQSEDVTNFLQAQPKGRFKPDGYNWGIRSNKYPDLDRKRLDLCVQGSDDSKPNTISKGFDSAAEANEAVQSITNVVNALDSAMEDSLVPQQEIPCRTEKTYVADNSKSKDAVSLVQGLFEDAEADDCLHEVWRLVTALRALDVDGDSKSKDSKGSKGSKDGKTGNGITTRIRHALISKETAKKLCLTGNKDWPDTLTWISSTVDFPSQFPLHFTEHAAQAVDVINKSQA